VEDQQEYRKSGQEVFIGTTIRAFVAVDNNNVEGHDTIKLPHLEFLLRRDANDLAGQKTSSLPARRIGVRKVRYSMKASLCARICVYVRKQLVHLDNN